MSAVTAASLLSNIKTASAKEWLASVRYHTAPFGPSFISEFDTLLAATHPRATPEAPLNAGDVVEIQGESSTGKTQILLHLALVTALPSTTTFELWSPESVNLLQESVEIGGKGQAVVVFDLDGRFDLLRLKRMMWSHFERRILEQCEEGPQHLHQARASPRELDAKVKLALKRVLYFRPSSLVSLAASIKLLPQIAAERIPQETLSLILIESISATASMAAWDLEQARQEAEVTPPANAPSGSVKAPVPQHPVRHVLRALGALRKETGVTTFLASAAHSPLASKSPFYRPVLPPPYPSPFAQDAPRQTRYDAEDPLSSDTPLPMTHHLTLHARPLQQLPASITREQALGGKGQQYKYMADNRQLTRAFVRLAGVGQVNPKDGSALAGTFDMRIIETSIDA